MYHLYTFSGLAVLTETETLTLQSLACCIRVRSTETSNMGRFLPRAYSISHLILLFL